MAGALKLRVLAGMLAWTATTAIQAAPAVEVLPDPTRPPPSLSAPAAAASAPAVDKNLALQSVLVRNGRPASAIIGGRLVSVGGQVGDARLVRLTETRAVLEGPEGETVLTLTPAAEKTPVPAAQASRIPRKR
jgi:MSHA biogenesis protein MshK